jgi:hypothetical protein
MPEYYESSDLHAVLAGYVLLSYFVPLPLIKTLHQRETEAAAFVPDLRTVFKSRLQAERNEGRALMEQREARLFDSDTQEEEESDWGWGVVRFLEDTVGKAMALEFEEQVLTYISPPIHLIEIGKGQYATDLSLGVEYLDGLLAKAETPLRGFDPQKWSVT